jgi:hypothetical protein
MMQGITTTLVFVQYKMIFLQKKKKKKKPLIFSKTIDFKILTFFTFYITLIFFITIKIIKKKFTTVQFFF